MCKMDELATTRFLLEGVIDGFMHAPCTVELLVHGDGTMSGSIKPITAKSPSSTATFYHDELEDDANASCADSYLIFDGSATSIPGALDDAPSYRVRFQVAKRSDIPNLVFVIDTTGHLSAQSGLQGQWSVSSSDPRDKVDVYDYKLAVRAVEYHGLDNRRPLALRPLTQGSYKLKGAVVADNGFVYEATWHLDLLPEGRLVGISDELDNYPQTCRMEGNWTRSSIDLMLYYVVNGVTGTYKNTGQVHGSVFRGRCVNTARPDSTIERGDVEFRAVQVRRRWNHDDHSLYPREFQAAVLTCLLTNFRPSAAGATALPNNVWSNVFSFCGFHWFNV